MKNTALLFFLVLGLALPTETILDIDFTKGLAPVDHATMGTCRGVLPSGVSDNFSSWSEGQCETKLMTEDGRTFLRFAADADKGAVQFSIPCAYIDKARCF